MTSDEFPCDRSWPSILIFVHAGTLDTSQPPRDFETTIDSSSLFQEQILLTRVINRLSIENPCRHPWQAEINSYASRIRCFGMDEMVLSSCEASLTNSKRKVERIEIYFECDGKDVSHAALDKKKARIWAPHCQGYMTCL